MKLRLIVLLMLLMSWQTHAWAQPHQSILIKLPGINDLTQVEQDIYAAMNAGPQPWPQIAIALQNVGAKFKEQLPVLDWTHWRIESGLALDSLQPLLRAIEPAIIVQKNQRYRPVVAAPDDPEFSRQWGLANTAQKLLANADPVDIKSSDQDFTIDTGTAGIDVGALQVWDTQDGDSNIVIAILDTGIATNTPDIANIVTAGHDFCEGDNDPDDDTGHGTNIAAVIAAKRNDGIGVAGLASGVKVMPIRFIGNRFPSEDLCSGESIPDVCECNLSTAAVKGLNFAVENGADVVNMSFGGSEEDPIFKDAMRAAVDAGVVLVAAAGNEGVDITSTPVYPASDNIPGLISVAAHTNDNHLASFSNYGVHVDIAAPGTSIRTAEPPAVDHFQFNNFKDLIPEPDTDKLGFIMTDDYRQNTLPLHSDFSLDDNGNWGVFIIENGPTLLVMDAQRAVDSDDGFSGYRSSSKGSWTSQDTVVGINTQVRVNLEAYLADGDAIHIDLAPNGAPFESVVKITGTQVFPVVIPLDDVYASIDSIAVRVRLDIKNGSTENVAGGAYFYGVQLWERAEPNDTDLLPSHIYTQGTSLAAPYVAATAGLILSQRPQQSPLVVIDQIIASAASVADKNLIAGDRRLDAASAINGEAALFVPHDSPYGESALSLTNAEIGTPVTFHVGYIEPKTTSRPQEVSVLVTPPAGAQSTIVLSENVDNLPSTQAATLIYNGSFTPDAAGTWSYRIDAIDSTGSTVRPLFGSLFVAGATTAVTDATDLPEGGCGCQITPTNPTRGLGSMLLSWVLVGGALLIWRWPTIREDLGA